VVLGLLLSLPAAAEEKGTAPEQPPTVVPLEGEEIPLWPGDAPGSEGLSLQEALTERSDDPVLHDRIFTQILQPSLRVYRPAVPNGVAVIVAPGGAYRRVVIDKEGLDIAQWLNGLGITAFVLKYRLPDEGHRAPADVPLQDAQRAVRLVRHRAEALGIDPQRIGVLGFSAGGHLAGTLAAHHGTTVYPPAHGESIQSARPDFLILVYPVVAKDFLRSDDPEKYPGLREVVSKYPLDAGVSKDWPPTFLLQAADDPAVKAEGALRLYQSLQTAGVPSELHVFPSGGHGFGIRNAKGPVARWPELCGEWMRGLGGLAAGDG
jgi:acetyl esterase/lipase